MTMPTTHYTPPTYMAMWDTADNYLRTCKAGEYRELRKAKTLDDRIRGMIESAEEYAAMLIEGGEAVDTAWNRAIRSRLLESAEE